MQKHPLCKGKKVRALKDIIHMTERQFPQPPAQKLLLVTGRPLLEKEPKTNQLAAENLQLLNYIVQHGMWNGSVQVFEAGETVLKGTNYSKYMPSIAGGIVNYFLSINAKVFIGTEVSSYSTDVQTTRFFRGNLENYKYLPQRLVKTTFVNDKNPPRFEC